MSTVKIQLPTVLRQHAGGAKTVEATGDTVGEVFADLARRYPALAAQLAPDGDLGVFVNVFVDDEDIRYLDGLDTPVRDDAEITILPAVAGGAR
ncbi:MAG: molybdopterin synthase sulfur carrier subunit [Acidimicrobiia bacterium]|jgi:molybdopterin converting factor small subunit|nr:MAG: molybdopterin synthase sulfur carrier subunit [Acidimicrobiia bacterium]